jgi:hypothetical protein
MEEILMKRFLMLLAAAVAVAMLWAPATADAELLTAIDDTILLTNEASTSPNSPGAHWNFGGRTELILGPTDNVLQVRHVLLRFDVSSIASQINDDIDIESATLTLTERSSRNALNGDQSRTFDVFGVVTDNEGWVEGTINGDAQTGAVCLARKAENTVYWKGGVNTIFTFGTDTGTSALGSGTVVFSTASTDKLVFDLDAAGLKPLLAEWLAADTTNAGTNAGLAIESDGTLGQVFFDSLETDIDPITEGQQPGSPAVLDITFVPEPSSLALLGLGALLLIRRRRRG